MTLYRHPHVLPSPQLAKAHRLDEILRQSASILGPKLQQLMKPGVEAGLSLSFHIQDGTLNHIKESQEDRHNNRPRTVDPSETAATPHEISSVLKSAITSLRTRLEMSLVTGFHGVVILSIDIDDGHSRMVKCGGERVHKAVSSKVPV